MRGVRSGNLRIALYAILRFFSTRPYFTAQLETPSYYLIWPLDYNGELGLLPSNT